jgi:hypothetical protein
LIVSIQDFQLVQLFQLGALFFTHGTGIPARRDRLTPLPQVLLKILGILSKGTSFFFKNIGKSPKGTSFAEGDKIKRGVGSGI